MHSLFLSFLDPPAECRSYVSLNESNRYWIYDDSNTYCDKPIITSNQWYRFTGKAGTMMASYCIPQSTCNTQMVGWVSGNHPTVAYELVSGTVCMHGGSTCCHTRYPVDIRNCSGHYVYKLQQPSGCNQRYCGVNGKLILHYNILVI